MGESLHLLFLDTFSPGLLSLEAAVRATCPDVDVRMEAWHRPAEAPDLEALDRLLDTVRPAVVGLSSYSLHFPLALQVAARVRQRLPGVPIVLGGLHATSFPEGVGRYPEFDWYVRGSGVRVGPALFRALLDGTPDPAGLPSLAFRRDGAVVTTAMETPPDSLDAEPPIDWSRLPVEATQDRRWILYDWPYEWTVTKPFPYETGRGCNHACGFCERLGRSQLRTKGLDRVVRDLVEIRDRFDVCRFFLTDDNIYTDRERFVALLRRVEPLGLRIWTEVKADEIDRDLIDRMVGAGLDMMYCSPESASPRIRGMMCKPIDMDRLLRNVEYARSKGVFILSTFVLGWPTETREEAQATLRLATEGPFDLRYLLPLIYYARAPVGRHLAGLGIEPDTPAYFRHLRGPMEVCLAEYPRPEYAAMVDDTARVLNRAALGSPEGLARLARLGVRPLAGAPGGPELPPASPPEPVAEVRTPPAPPPPRALAVAWREVLAPAPGLARAYRGVLALLRDPAGEVEVGPAVLEDASLRVEVSVRGHGGTLFFQRRRPGQGAYRSTRDVDVGYEARPGAPAVDVQVLVALAGRCARRLAAAEAAGGSLGLPEGPLATPVAEVRVAPEPGPGPASGAPDPAFLARLPSAMGGEGRRRVVAALADEADLGWASALPGAGGLPPGCEVWAAWEGGAPLPEGLVARLVAAGFRRLRLPAGGPGAADALREAARQVPVQLAVRLDRPADDPAGPVAVPVDAADVSLLLEAGDGLHATAAPPPEIARPDVSWEVAGAAPGGILARLPAMR